VEEEGCYLGKSESRHDYSIAVPLFHCTLQLKVLRRISISNLGFENDRHLLESELELAAALSSDPTTSVA
jgi:hypothetical protein